MTVRFYIRTKTKNANIYISVSVPGNIKYRKKTGLLVDSAKWNPKKQLPDNSTAANKNLGFQLVKLKNRIIEDYNSQMVNMESRFKENDWLDGLISGKKHQNTVLSATRKLIDNADRLPNQKGGTGLSNGRVKIYRVFEKKIVEYSPTWKITDVKKSTVDKFKSWLYGKGYSDNYVHSFISRLKAVCNYSGVALHPDFRQIKVIQKPKENILTLTPEDLKTISRLRLTDELDNARRWLLLGCQLGQRGGDLLKMKEFRILNGIRIIEVKQQKTDKIIAIPVNNKAWEILKYGFPRPITQHNFNLYVKTIASRAKIKRWKEVSSHIMRRSFATNYYGKVPTPILMRITGHSKERTFLSYVGKSSLDNAIDAMEWFNRLD